MPGVEQLNIGQDELQKNAEVAEVAPEDNIDNAESLSDFNEQLKNLMDNKAEQIASAGNQKVEAGIAQIGLSPEDAATIKQELGVDQSLADIAAEAKGINDEYREETRQLLAEQPPAEPVSEMPIENNSDDYREETRQLLAEPTIEPSVEPPAEPVAKLPIENVATVENTEAAQEYQTIDEEKQYLEKINAKLKPEDAANFEKRYADERTGAAYFKQEVAQYVEKAGVTHESIPGLEGKAFSSETKAIVAETINRQIDKLLLSKERGSYNPEKQQIMLAESARYLDLVEKAQAEGDIDPEISADDILKLVEENVWATAFQDRAASENTLGDHGVRHIVGYNIKICEQIYDELARNAKESGGQEPKAIDRLSTHQIMIMHDMGYATAPVREGIDQGDFTADKGHNLLSSKILRERSNDPNDVISKVFSKEQIDIMHEGVLKHDSSEVDIDPIAKDPIKRKKNILSTIHIADNTHAFEDKLPEILYAVPESLETMLIMKTAGEIGDAETVEAAKIKLVETIKNNENFSMDDKIALERAVIGVETNGKRHGGLSAESYKFNVGRICGNKPEVSIGPDGKVKILVQASDVHTEVTGLFGLESYKQLVKFVSDLTGKKAEQIDLDDSESIDSDKIDISVNKTNENNKIESSEYQKQVEEIINNEFVRDFRHEDKSRARKQKLIEKSLKLYSVGKDGAPVMEGLKADAAVMIETLNVKLSEIKELRKASLEKCKKGLGYGQQ